MNNTSVSSEVKNPRRIAAQAFIIIVLLAVVVNLVVEFLQFIIAFKIPVVAGMGMCAFVMAAYYLSILLSNGETRGCYKAAVIGFIGYASMGMIDILVLRMIC